MRERQDHRHPRDQGVAEADDNPHPGLNRDCSGRRKSERRAETWHYKERGDNKDARHVNDRRKGILLTHIKRLTVLRLIASVGAIGILAFMAIRATRNLDFGAITWWPLPLAFVGSAAWWLLGARSWAILLSGRSSWQDMSMWCRTQALRYLPGGIWAPAARAVAISGGILARVSTVVTDNAIALCAALATGSAALAARGDLRWLPGVAVIGLPYLASNLAVRRTRISSRRTLQATWNYVVAFAAYSLAAVFVQAAVSGFHEPLGVAGAAAIAWSVGFIVVIVPSGVGVRELIYVALLTSAVPTEEATAAALILRALTTIAELAVLLVVAGTSLPARTSIADPPPDR